MTRGTLVNKFEEGKPENYEALKKQASDNSSWRNRKSAVEQLGKWKCRETKDVLWRRMMSDKVYQVQHAAFLALQAFGENVRLPKKKKGKLIPDITNKLAKIKKSMPYEHSYEDFKKEFSKLRPVEFDTYEGDKGSRFDSWLENVWKTLPRNLGL